MTDWFHRHPLKATSKLPFSVQSCTKSLECKVLCSEAAKRREELLKYLANPSTDCQTMLAVTNLYLPILIGFVNAPSNTNGTNLKNFVSSKWTDSLDEKGSKPKLVNDATFELYSMLFNVALWYTKHAAKVASQENIGEEEAKDVYTSLRSAAGIFSLLQTTYLTKIETEKPEGSDLDSSILDAYINQCLAEAQEITIARAIELKHKPQLICGLASQTSKTYEKANLALSQFNTKRVGKWRKYLEFKQYCYESYAYIYFGEDLLSQEKAGAAIAVINQAKEPYEKAIRAGQSYAKTDGVGLSSKPANHYFFRRLPDFIERTRGKMERENCLLFHQKVPISAPFMDVKPEYGLATPLQVTLDLTPDTRWEKAYEGFTGTALLSSVTDSNKSRSSKITTQDDVPIEYIKEQPIFSTDKDPNNNSGCILS